MGRDEKIARRAFEKGKAAFEILRMRIILPPAEKESIGRYRRQAVRINKIQTAPVLAGAPRPTRAPGRVTRSEMCGNIHRARGERLAIFERLHSRHSVDRCN